ncbi:MAG: biotin carboxylase N-terminal domain-containing protein [Actinomycetaceae bacterium]|nr:biotin carboxylase N-terminal domain-containing protein [Actinomycetaceae bacterium]
MISRVLVANRSEIALRVIRTAREMGIESVAVYADSDRDAQFVTEADAAYALGGNAYAETYMNADKLLDIAARAGADAVHPGYGFLSEVPSFARAVIDADMAWVGPSPEVLDALGDKIKARRLAESVDVSPVAGISDPVSSREVVDDFVATHGFPIVTKKADGGGGRGITVMESDADLDLFFTAHGHEAEGFFVERFIRTARHVETQCARDSHGGFAVVSTRDCSVQRRNQKLIEEAPAPALAEGVEDELVEASRRLFEAVGYEGLGTCEFLVEADGRVSFLEVNPRLQVEHTVSEEVTGLDLVDMQLRIAGGGHIGEVPAPRAHSFEFRITCEDPAGGMIPSTGTITRLRWPLGHGVRIESGINEGVAITPDFDPMLAKLIVTAPTRQAAIARSRRALHELDIVGVATPADFYSAVIALDDFSPSAPSTRWFEDEILPALADPAKAEALGVRAAPAQSASPAQGAAPAEERATFVVEVDGRRVQLTVPRTMFASAGATSAPRAQPLRGGARARGDAKSGELVDPTGMVNSQIQAIVVRVCVEPGQKVARGDLLVVLESMKMESYVHAPYDGTVADIVVEGGQNVSAFQPLVRVLREGDDSRKENS